MPDCSPDTPKKTYQPLLYSFFFLSGISALLYQVIWTKKLALLFGVTTYAISTTLSVFMLGLALGSRYFGSVADRTKSPLRCYFFLEAGIAASAAVSLLLLEAMNTIMAGLGFSSFSSIGFLCLRLMGSFLVLIVPTFLMGGTLPVLAKEFVTTSATAGRKLAMLYAVNTFGGVIGSLLVGFIAIPVLGVRGTLLAGVAINSSIALFTYLILTRREQIDRGIDSQGAERKRQQVIPRLPVSLSPAAPPHRRAVSNMMLAAFFTAGFAALAAEVVWTRMLLLNLDATAQAFSGMLAIYLLGLALGSIAAGKVVDRFDPARGYAVLQVLAGVSIGACMFFFASRGEIISGGYLYWLLRGSAGNTWSHAIFSVGLCLFQSTLLLFIPTFLMGCSFPFAGRFFAEEVATVGKKLGGAYMWNTLGAMMGPLLCGFWCLPRYGIQTTLLLCAIAGVVSGTAVLVCIARQPVKWAIGTALSVSLLAVAVLVLPGQSLALSRQHRFGNVLHYQEDLSGSVFVLEHKSKIENYRQLMVGSTSMISDNFICRRYTRLIGHLPMLMHPEPRKALVICLGSGMTLSAIACHPGVQSIDCVDLSEGVVYAARNYFNEANNNVLDDPRVHVIVNDGRTHLLGTSESYDVIALEPPPPSNAGASNLYSREFYQLCRMRMSSHGMVVQWIPYHGGTFAQLRAMIATMQAVFPASTLWSLCNGEEYCVIGHMDGSAIPYERLNQRLAPRSVAANLGPVGIRTAEDVLACFVMGPAGIKKFTEQAALITDDQPGIGYDTAAYDFLDSASNAFWREVQIASMVTLSYSEYPSVFFKYKNERDSLDFQERFKPVKKAWILNERAVEISATGLSENSTALGLDRDFVAPIELYPENPYYQYVNSRSIYTKALLQLAAFFKGNGNSSLVERYSADAKKLTP